MTANTANIELTDAIRVERDEAWHAEVRREIVCVLADREAHSLSANLVAWTICAIISVAIGLDQFLIAALVLRLVAIGLTRLTCSQLRHALRDGKPVDTYFRNAGLALASSGISWGMLTWPMLDAALIDAAGIGLLTTVIVGVCLICSLVGLSPLMLIGFAACFATSVFFGGFVIHDGAQPAICAAVMLPLFGAVPFGIGTRRQAILAAQDAVDNHRLREEIATALQSAEFLSRHDPLTGLKNRRAFYEDNLADCPANIQRALVALDLDHFKSINDRFGHAVGDDVLIRVAEVLRVESGKQHPLQFTAYRLGGEEFALAVTGMSEDAATDLANDLREKIAAAFPPDDLPDLRVTASLGVSEWPADMPLETAMSHADRALYLAKSSGRNCVIRDIPASRAA